MAPRSTSRRWLRAAVPAATTAFALALAVSPAAAQPTTVAEAATAVADTAQQIQVLSEQVNDAELAVAGAQATAATALAAAEAADAAVLALQPQVDALVRSRFVGAVPSGLETLLTSGSADDMLQARSTVEQLADHTDDVLGALTAAQATAAQTRADADAAAGAATAALSAVQTQRDELETQLAGYEADYARLTAAQQGAVLLAVAGPTLSADSTAAAAAAAPAAAPSEAAATAVSTALAQIGKPYVVGADGPDGFDCSGLTQFAYAAAGIGLPHSSRAQSGLGVPVARADLQPGDLVFFYSPVSHVGLYVGNGQMVHASVTGRPVAVTSVDQRGYAGARRVS